MGKILDRLSLYFVFLFSVPTILIIGSWNSLPGDFMFPVKLTMESGLALVVSPSYAASSSLAVKYTERRFAEAHKLLAEEHSVKGLPYLENQVEETKTTIEKAPDLETKQVLTDKYVETLRQANDTLEAQKQIIINSQQPATQSTNNSVNTGYQNTPNTYQKTDTFTDQIQPTPTPYRYVRNTSPSPAVQTLSQNTPTPTAAIHVAQGQTIPTPTPVMPVASNGTVANQIAQTQQTINETIKELEDNRNKMDKHDSDKGNPDNESLKDKKNNSSDSMKSDKED